MRDALLDAAFASLDEEGPDFRVERLADRAGASKALVFHHFGSRAGLLDAMAARVLAQTQDGLARLAEDYPNPRERLDALARALLDEPRESTPAQARRVLLFWLADDRAGGCRGALRDALLADFVRETVREGVTLGAMRLADPPAAGERAATMMLARWHGATVLYASGAPVDFEVEQERLVAELARALG